MPFHNPSIFKGEHSFGTTPGVPLSTDSNNQVISGLPVTEVTATANATTSSGTDALLTGMTITPTPGTYLVLFSTDMSTNNVGSTTTLSLYNNGVRDANTVRALSPFDGGALSAGSASCGVSINKIIVVTAGAVQIEWNTNGGTSTCGPRTLNLIRIA